MTMMPMIITTTMIMIMIIMIMARTANMIVTLTKNVKRMQNDS